MRNHEHMVTNNKYRNKINKKERHGNNNKEKHLQRQDNE